MFTENDIINHVDACVCSASEIDASHETVQSMSGYRFSTQEPIQKNQFPVLSDFKFFHTNMIASQKFHENRLM